MPIQDQAGLRIIETDDDLEETRIEAIGFVFHGVIPVEGSKRQPKAATNVLHFARCAKLDKIIETESKIWFRSIRVAKQHLDQVIGENRWKWCKICEREVTQRILNER